jgi:hypothetical protein
MDLHPAVVFQVVVAGLAAVVGFQVAVPAVDGKITEMYL